MLFKKIKDNRLRQVVNKHEKKKLIYKVILSNLFSVKVLNFKRKIIFKKLINMQAKIGRVSKVRITRRCLLTGRRAGINRTYSISRIKLRELLQFGIIPGSFKAAW